MPRQSKPGSPPDPDPTVRPGGGPGAGDELPAFTHASHEVFDGQVHLRAGQIRDPDAAAVADRIAPDGDSVADAVRDVVGRTEAEPNFSLRNFPALTSTERQVTLRRTESGEREVDALWCAIDAQSEALSFPRYVDFLRRVCVPRFASHRAETLPAGTSAEAVCRIPGVDLYQYLKTATEVFLLLNCGICPAAGSPPPSVAFTMGLNREGYDATCGAGGLSYDEALRKLTTFMGHPGNNYLELVIQGAFPGGTVEAGSQFCLALEDERLDAPCLLELIWSYWMEEGMLNQTVAAITRRFQNVRRPGPGPDPLAELELDPLRPLSGFIWGWLQDEPGRLSVVRRAYEYNHHYGLTLYGRAVPPLRAADPRSRFLEGFHNLLRQAAAFYREDNDTTVIADPFPVLNSLREVHLLLAEGAHNQFRDLPWQARGEMMMQQWLIARPEMREFLRGRHMVAYPEGWMGGVDAMKRLQGWTDTSVRYFRDLAVAGERILLSIRYAPWNDAGQEDARSWLRHFREDVQQYIHAYHTATGVALGDDVVEVRNRADARYLQPSYHLRNRLVASRRGARQRG